MRFIFFILLLMLNSSAFSQDYFSRIIPFEFGNSNFVQMLYEQNGYFIPIIYDSNTFIVSVKKDEIEYDIIDDFTISRYGLCSFEDSQFYYFGKDRSKPKGLEIQSSYTDFSSFSSQEISTDGDFNFPTVASKLRDSIFYCTYTKDFDSLDVKRPEFLALNLKTKEEIRIQFNSDLNFTVPFAINSTLDGNIFISSGIRIPNIPKSFGQLIKMDRNGNIIWRNDGNEEFENGGIPAWAAQLSNSSIVQTYYVDRRSDLEFIANNWFELPIRLKWYNKDGDSIAQKLIITPKKQYVRYSGLKKGNGDYFFAYGEYEDSTPFIDDLHYAHLIKFSNQGDTIWVRNYQHPNFEEPRISHDIRDIIEHDDGNISILANIRPVGEKNEIWLFKVNSDGCYINEECEDMSDIVNVKDKEISNVLTIFPNPATEHISIDLSEGRFSQVDILDQLGIRQISLQTPHHSEVQVDISQLSPGLYFVVLQDEHQQRAIKKFIKL